MFDEYKNGRTPNPDILCNREIKFDVFLKSAIELGADYIATGHYCQKIDYKDGSFGLIAGADPNKDQSYFLCQLSQEQLSKVLFPIGAMLKPEVRKIAQENGLHNANKKDSQGLCFVGKISLPIFLQQKLDPIQGNVVELPSDLVQYKKYEALKRTEDNVELLAAPFVYTPKMGQVVTSHQGAHYYTIGQRRGLHIGGRPKPSFIVGLNVASNTVYSGQTDKHPGLNKYALRIALKDLHFISSIYSHANINGLNCNVRIRYRQKLQKGMVIIKDTGVYILFETIQRGITPGQFAALYVLDEVIASGVIAH
jgi:tRNA-specific 2-thiouridylase